MGRLVYIIPTSVELGGLPVSILLHSYAFISSLDWCVTKAISEGGQLKFQFTTPPYP